MVDKNKFSDKTFIIPSLQLPHYKAFCNIQSDLVGIKAIGLLSLPFSWTPPFIVITSLAHKKWKSERESKNTLFLKNLSWLINNENQWSKYIAFLCNYSDSLIIRSSATNESLSERGLFKSHCCNFTDDEILATVSYLWEEAENILQSFHQKNLIYLPLIIQPYIRRLSSGHLSNERRVSKNKKSWICEFEIPFKKNIFTTKFSVKKLQDLNLQIDLSCNSQDKLDKKIKDVAALSIDFDYRCHYEWVWDGNRLWIVQKDTENIFKGEPPGSKWPIQAVRNDNLQAMHEFIEEPNVKGEWPKIECLRVMKSCELPIARVFILENSITLKQLSKRIISQNLQNDLLRLLQLPIVIRTDISKSVTPDSLLLPRTDALININSAIEFLIKTTTDFQKNGLNFDEFCFIIHHFIAARACALSLSRPNIPRVRIDSSWGIPDGLHYYPHDSFEVDLWNLKNLRKRIRCKTKYLDIDKDGNWIEVNSGSPWDWRASLKKNEIIEIAEYSYKLSKRLNCPVETMFFIGINPMHSKRNCLPWYYTTEEIPEFDQENSELKYVGNHITISNELSLKKLEDRLRINNIQKKTSLRLKPTTELIRSRNFINKVIQIASKNNLPVELEGSILSHVYYILVRNGIKIRCVEAFKPKTTIQRFGKLVRDLIPLRIESHGELPRTFKVKAEELIPLLKAKAVEEALELFWESDTVKTFEELADILEVIESICHLYSRSFDDLKAAMQIKRNKRGGFKNGIVLMETQEVPLINSERKEMSLFDKNETNNIHKGLIKSKSFFSEKERVPQKKGKNIVMPLIPPDPTKFGSRSIIPLADGKNEAIITYTQKEIVINLQPAGYSYKNNNQLALFPIEKD